MSTPDQTPKSKRDLYLVTDTTPEQVVVSRSTVQAILRWIKPDSEAERRQFIERERSRGNKVEAISTNFGKVLAVADQEYVEQGEKVVIDNQTPFFGLPIRGESEVLPAGELLHPGDIIAIDHNEDSGETALHLVYATEE